MRGKWTLVPFPVKSDFLWVTELMPTGKQKRLQTGRIGWRKTQSA